MQLVDGKIEVEEEEYDATWSSESWKCPGPDGLSNSSVLLS